MSPIGRTIRAFALGWGIALALGCQSLGLSAGETPAPGLPPAVQAPPAGGVTGLPGGGGGVNPALACPIDWEDQLTAAIANVSVRAARDALTFDQRLLAQSTNGASQATGEGARQDFDQLVDRLEAHGDLAAGDAARIRRLVACYGL